MTAANGDFYIDNLTHDFYLREDDAWHLKGNIGPNGSAGVGPPLGSPAPEGLYVDIGAGDIYIDGAFVGTLPGGASVGPPGADGIDGARGFDGDDGSDGDDGPPGKAGRDGIDGADGANGIDGAPGADGADGANGIDGARGLFGFPGEDGEDGEPAPVIPGKDGRNGIDGRNGCDGVDGADGETGPPGRNGTDGTTGDTGPIAGVPMIYVVSTSSVGAGQFGFNNSTFSSATQCNIAKADGSGADISTLLAALPVGTVITVTNDPFNNNLFIFKITGPLIDNGVYDTFPITPMQKIGTWTNGSVGRAGFGCPGADGLRGSPGEDGRDGEDGDRGTTGATGFRAGLRYALNTATSGDPGVGKYLFNNASFGSATQVNINKQTLDSQAIASLLVLGSPAILAFIAQDGTKYQFATTSGTPTNNTTYYTFTISPAQSSGTLVNGEVFFLQIFINGANGTNGAGVPTGGSNGQFLKKLSGTDFDTAWVNFPARQPILTATADYYVATTGNDSNAGTAAGVPFRTLQKAVNTIATLDIGNFGVNVHVSDGTYAENVVATAPWVGAGAVTFIGNVTTPGNCIISGGAGDCFQVTDNATLVIQGFKFVNTTGTFHLAAIRGGSIKYGTVEFGAAGAAHIRIQDFGRVTCIGNYTISGSSVAHINNVEGMIRIQGFTITLTGTPDFSTGFVFGNQNGLNLITGNTFSGSATGPRFNIGVGATLSVQNIGLSGLPGSTNGVLYGGGQYDGLICKGVTSKSANYTTVGNDQLTIDAIILHPSADTTARTFTIDANANVPYPLGTIFRFVNQNGAGVLTIAINTDTMRLAGAGTTGSRTLAANGVAEAIKIATTEWIISGTGLT